MEILDSSHHHIGYGKLLANLLHFGRLLRQAGIPVSANQVSSLAEGLVHIDLSSREDFYHAARGFFLHDISRLQQFDIAFNLFWSQYFQILVDLPGTKKQDHQNRLLEDDHASIKVRSPRIDTKIKLPQENYNPRKSDFEVQSTFSPDEILRSKDFHEYSDEEFQRAKLIIHDLTFSFEQRRSRRKIRARKQTKLIDRRRSMRNYLGIENEIIEFEWRKFKFKSRPIILLCDISGSMERYSKIFLHFLYAMAQETRRIETFVFGTRLTRLTKQLRHADIDQVLENLSLNILDWSGGTRIGESLKTFNFVWSRRLPSQNAIVMVISDGWDRGDDILLEREISRLSRISHRLIWLNPLAGSDEYQPLVSGIKTVLPYVDDFLPLANLENLDALVYKLDSLG